LIKSWFLRRIVLLIAATILLSALFTTILFVVAARSIVAEMVATDLVPRAEYFSNLMTRYLEGTMPKDVLKTMVSDATVLGANIHVCDAQGGYYFEATSPETESGSDGAEDYVKLLAASIVSVVKGNRIVSQVHSSTTGRDYLVVGMPIAQDDKIVGAVLLTKPLMDLSGTVTTLNNSLFVSMLIAFAVMLIPAYLAARRMIRPINQMRGVALHMARGDYSVRADETRKGEVGELALAFNYLATQLSATISSLVVERNRLKNTLDGLNEGIVAVDNTGSITHTNPSVLRLFGHDAAAQITEREQLIPDESVWKDFDFAIQERCPMVRSLSQGSIVLRVSISPLEDENGTVVGAVGWSRCSGITWPTCPTSCARRWPGSAGWPRRCTTASSAPSRINSGITAISCGNLCACRGLSMIYWSFRACRPGQWPCSAARWTSARCSGKWGKSTGTWWKRLVWSFGWISILPPVRARGATRTG